LFAVDTAWGLALVVPEIGRYVDITQAEPDEMQIAGMSCRNPTTNSGTGTARKYRRVSGFFA
jgi:hypothetical protein